MDVRIVTDGEALEEAAVVLCHLRTQFTFASLLRQVKKQVKEGYQLACVYDGDKIVAVGGFVIGLKLAWGKFIYVDDVIALPEERSKGAGKVLLDWLKKYAKQQGCDQLHLDSGVQRFDAHRFYHREGLNIASHHLSNTNIQDG
ncbi:MULTISPECIES: GNAT family N-acetyltransferase [Corallincola]|uniref:GNAT family N-acetyltransferase n=3 Tax=Corallincola TaxID=1775176 RepID=A0A368N449_9GAMM|nr:MULTISPECIES: GNAT family N-acetyltransferase [Corallincola]RCU45347.1 GNAT family N-acetyltransferase [Corallincola holothuriorum]TAA43641.1 GNAT family N-acetyltransferase [Corallincola spongiicola]TCI02893.1 GNAT family N-acetyltransferase [Corallincola luteus]